MRADAFRRLKIYRLIRGLFTIPARRGTVRHSAGLLLQVILWKLPRTYQGHGLVRRSPRDLPVGLADMGSRSSVESISGSFAVRGGASRATGTRQHLPTKLGSSSIQLGSGWSRLSKG